MSAPSETPGAEKPRRNTRFKPGQSGNPLGRPKRKLDMSVALNKALNDKILVTNLGTTRTGMEAYVQSIVDRVLQGETMPNYRVLINDNAHYMDESQRGDHGVFADGDRAIAACKKIVDDELNTMWQRGMTAKELYRLYVAFGPDPFVAPLNLKDPEVKFSAWSYAKKRCKDLCQVGALGRI